MSTIADAQVAHNYNGHNGHFFGCLRFPYTDLFLLKIKKRRGNLYLLLVPLPEAFALPIIV